MPFTKRFFYVPCKGEECFKLAEVIREKAPAVEQVDISISDHGLYIVMYGYESDVKSAWRYVRSLVASYKSAVKTKHGLTRVKVEYIVSKVRRTFPPRLLVEVLKRMGYRAELSEDSSSIETNAPVEKLEELADLIAKRADEVRYEVRGTATKYYVVAASILSGKPVSEVLNIGVALGHLKLDENEKYSIVVEWRQALSEFLSKVGSSSSQTS